MSAYKHQLECLERFGDTEAFALLAEMGTGKTWIVINNLARLYQNGKVRSALVFAPNGVHANWVRELEKHCPVEFEAFVWGPKKTAAFLGSFSNFISMVTTRPKILLMNWEALQNKRGYEAAAEFCLRHKDLMLVADESDAIKNPTAVRTKNLMRLKPFSAYRRIMTGTPVTNSPFDAYSQFNFLSPNILRCNSYYAFKAEYSELVRSGPLIEHIRNRTNRTPQLVAKDKDGRPKYRNLEKLHALMAPHSFRVLKSECLDLPDKVYKTVVFELTKQQQEVYDKLRKTCRILFDGEETPVTKLTALGKLAQVTSGYYLHNESPNPIKIEGDNPKLDIAVDRIRAIVAEGNQVIVWARYRNEIEDLHKSLEDIEHVLYHGDIGKDERQEAIDNFQEGKARVFIATQQAAGVGLTLHAATFVLYYSNSFSLRDRLQSEDRAHRIGQNRTVTYINLVASGTIDEYVVRALESKKNIAELVVDGVGLDDFI